MKSVLILFLILLVMSAHAEGEIEFCIEAAAYKYNIAPELIKAIIEVESGGNSNAVNVAGRSFYPDNQTDAEVIIGQSKNSSFDVGLMQVNKWWFDKYDYDYTYGLDPCFNIHLGSWILAYEISRHGYSWEAVGRYHSPKTQYQKDYQAKIASVLKTIIR
jgi:soluble lytic murein transglycosylase-like protein